MAYEAPADQTKPKAKKDTKADADLLKQALEDYDSAYEFQRGNIDDANEDLRFRRGRQEDQWTPEALAMRGDRPCLTINGLPQFIRQVTGDMRQMRPSIKVNPVDSRGDPKTAEVLAGLVRYVENRSFAKHIYTTAADSQVACGIGHWQVTSEYAGSSTFNQELRIVGIEDGVSVLWDPDSVLPTREDAMFCHVPFDISRRKFEKQWPDKPVEGFANEMHHAAEGWYTGDSVRVSVYWLKKPIKRSLVLAPDGAIDDVTEQTEGFTKEQLKDAAQFYQAQGFRFEQRDSFKVCRYLVTAATVLEGPTEWPGMHIPIVPVLGEEVRIGREVYRHGVVRYARDPQRMVNYYASADAEVVALQPKAPWIATKKQVQNHMDQWETANTQNHSVLIYDTDPQAPNSAPQRVSPPVASQAIQLGKTQALEDMKRVIGIYDSGLGQRSNETSGVAIQARDRQSDTGTFVYIDNFNMAIQRTGQILLDLIPHIYDTERRIRIIGADGSENLVDINKPQIEGGQETVTHDVTVGAYDVTLDTGPTYATRRQEAQDGMKAFLQAFPEAAPVIGDLYAKGQDWQYADEIGKRLESVLPPQIKQMIEKDKLASSPDAEPDPAQQAEQQAQQQAMQQQQMVEAAGMEKIKLEVQEAQAKTEAAQENARKAKADADTAEANAEAAKSKAEMSRATAANTHMENLRAIQSHDVDMERGQEVHETDMERGQEAHDTDMAQRSDPKPSKKSKGEDSPRAMIEVKHGADEITGPMSEAIAMLAQHVADSQRGLQEQIAQSQSQQSEMLLAAIKAMGQPKKIIRDPKTGKVLGVESVTLN